MSKHNLSFAERVNEVLADPLSLPAAHRGWLPRWIETTGITLPLSSIIGWTKLVTTESGKATDADKLDGLDSLAFLRMVGAAQTRYHGRLSALPGSPLDGDIVDLDVGDGLIWRFVYNSGGGTYKWEFAGGSPATHFVDTAETTTSTTFVDLTTVGPTITASNAGEYLIEIGVEPEETAVGAACIATLKVGSAASADADAIIFFIPIADVGFGGLSRLQKKTVAAADVLKMQYRVASSGTGTFRRRWIRVIPIRIS